MKTGNFTLRAAKKEFTEIGTPIIYETASFDCKVAEVDPRIIAEMKEKLENFKLKGGE